MVEIANMVQTNKIDGDLHLTYGNNLLHIPVSTALKESVIDCSNISLVLFDCDNR